MLNEHDVVARVARLELHELRFWVREGWVKPHESVQGPVFDDLDVARIVLVCDLRKDMSIPEDAVPVVLSLLDQIHGLRRELRELVGAVEMQPDAVRRAIVQAFQSRMGDDTAR